MRDIEKNTRLSHLNGREFKLDNMYINPIIIVDCSTHKNIRSWPMFTRTTKSSFFFFNIFYRVSLDTVIAINKLRVK
jgi:hypothetical protein